MKHYNLYMFDWDGTLAMTHDASLAIIREQLTRYDIELSDQQIVDRLFGRYPEGMLELGIPENELQTLRPEIHQYLKEHMPLAALYPHARQVLETIKQSGAKLALITASYRDIVDIAIANHKLSELFDVIITGDEMQVQKPDPGALLTAMKTLDITPEESIMIGDSAKDIADGNNAGTDTLLFYPPEHQTQHDLTVLKTHRPTYVIHSWQEFLDKTL